MVGREAAPSGKRPKQSFAGLWQLFAHTRPRWVTSNGNGGLPTHAGAHLQQAASMHAER